MKNLYVLLLALLFSFGCTAINDPDPIKPEPKPDPDPTTAEITIKTPDVVLSDVEGSTTTAEFTANATWTIEITDTKATPDWFEVSPKSGNAGEIELNIKATKSNDDYDDRSAYIKIKSGDVTKTITVTQKKKDAIILSKDRYELGAEGGTINVEVKSNVNYTVDILDDWIKQSATNTRALVTTNFNIVVQSNKEIEQRTGRVIIKGSGLADTITVVQKPSNASYMEVTIDVAGTLSELLEGTDPSTITALRLRGVMGFKDFVTVNILPNIELLDIENIAIDEIPDYALNYCTLTSITLPTSIKRIGKEAFKGSEKLRSIHIPASVETIEAAAFQGCSNLASVTFEAGSKLKTISGEYSSDYYYGAFSDCTSLTSITIPASVETIDATAFENCSNLASITFEAGSKLKTLSAFYDCTSLTSITIPASIETINAFSRCSKLASVTFEAGSKLKTLSAFYNCTSLTSITIPASVETIGYNAFSGCANLASVTFETGSKLKTIGGFFDCTSLTSITIPASVETIDAFRGCSKLASVTFEAGSKLKTLGGFSNCTPLTSITIPASVETIYAFYECSNLSSVIFEAGSKLRTLGGFNNCTSLTTVDASKCELITTIDNYAFGNCIALKLFEIGTVIPPTCGGETFIISVGSSSVLKVPAGSIEAYKAASGWGWRFAAIKALD